MSGGGGEWAMGRFGFCKDDGIKVKRLVQMPKHLDI
jgi:hypothetical protein